MATVMLVWERGGGLGHLLPLCPLAKGLADRGHRIVLAMRNIPGAKAFFDLPGLSLIPVPHPTPMNVPPILPSITFPHILHNAGFADPRILASMTRMWRRIYDDVRPDLIIFDASPFALLAARGLNCKRALVGTGFFAPPDLYPMPILRTWVKCDPERLTDDEDRILDNVNALLKSCSLPRLRQLSQLWAEVDASFLATLKELDHYPQRVGGDYCGNWATSTSTPTEPCWPPARYKRIFAYLKPLPSLDEILRTLSAIALPTLVYSPGADLPRLSSLCGPTVSLHTDPLDMHRVYRDCDLAILNATHGSTISLLLAGKPILQLPILLEQAICARSVKRLGLGFDADHTSPVRVQQQLHKLLQSVQHATQAAQFADQHTQFNPESQRNRIISRIQTLLD